MRRAASTLALALPLTVFAGIAQAADVQRSIEVDAPVEEVWDEVGDFCAIQAWHPNVKRCQIDDDDMTVYRTYEIADQDGSFREQLLESTPSAYFYRYAIAESPLDVVNYVGEFSVGPGANEASIVVWQAEFSAVGVNEDQAQGEIASMYETGLQGLADMFSQQ